MTTLDALQTIQIIAMFASVVTVILAIYAITLTSRLIREARTYILASQLSPIKIEPKKEAPPAPEPARTPAEAEQQKAAEIPERPAQPERPAEPQPTPHAQEAQPLLEAPRLTRIEDILTVFGLEGIVIFDSLGQVVEYAGKVEPGKVAAVMTELFNVAMMSGESTSGITMWNGSQIVVAVIGKIEAKTIYLYAKAPPETTKEDIARLIESSKFLLESIIGK